MKECYRTDFGLCKTHGTFHHTVCDYENKIQSLKSQLADKDKRIYEIDNARINQVQHLSGEINRQLNKVAERDKRIWNLEEEIRNHRCDDNKRKFVQA